METRHRNVLLHLANPSIGNEVRGLVRELAALAGVSRVVPVSRVSRVLLVAYDPSVIAVRTLLACARRGWSAARLVGV